ncbi:MAG: hypothetical protein R3256_03145 [Thalassovita sp.]|nr:hypothetical protein [Thalassovita sp.]
MARTKKRVPPVITKILKAVDDMSPSEAAEALQAAAEDESSVENRVLLLQARIKLLLDSQKPKRPTRKRKPKPKVEEAAETPPEPEETNTGTVTALDLDNLGALFGAVESGDPETAPPEEDNTPHIQTEESREVDFGDLDALLASDDDADPAPQTAADPGDAPAVDFDELVALMAGDDSAPPQEIDMSALDVSDETSIPTASAGAIQMPDLSALNDLADDEETAEDDDEDLTALMGMLSEDTAAEETQTQDTPAPSVPDEQPDQKAENESDELSALMGALDALGEEAESPLPETGTTIEGEETDPSAREQDAPDLTAAQDAGEPAGEDITNDLPGPSGELPDDAPQAAATDVAEDMELPDPAHAADSDAEQQDEEAQLADLLAAMTGATGPSEKSIAEQPVFETKQAAAEIDADQTAETEDAAVEPEADFAASEEAPAFDPETESAEPEPKDVGASDEIQANDPSETDEGMPEDAAIEEPQPDAQQGSETDTGIPGDDNDYPASDISELMAALSEPDEDTAPKTASLDPEADAETRDEAVLMNEEDASTPADIEGADNGDQDAPLTDEAAASNEEPPVSAPAVEAEDQSNALDEQEPDCSEFESLMAAAGQQEVSENVPETESVSEPVDVAVDPTAVSTAMPQDVTDEEITAAAVDTASPDPQADNTPLQNAADETQSAEAEDPATDAPAATATEEKATLDDLYRFFPK